MSEPRWRYATKDVRPLFKGTPSRCLWTRKPQRIKESYNGRAVDRWVRDIETFPPILSVDRAYCIKRFGRDLRPGEILELP